jgi:hypothetical protein
MDKYRIRRAIIEAVQSLEPGLCELEDVAQYPLLRMAAQTPDKLLAEVTGLVQHGYLRDGRPGREPLLGLTAKGRDQLLQDTDLDEYIWGGMASKFKAQGT